MADDAGEKKEKKEPVFTVASGIAFGEHKGHIVDRIERAANPASRKGVSVRRAAVGSVGAGGASGAPRGRARARAGEPGLVTRGCSVRSCGAKRADGVSTA
jgi:hypothetical protein